MGKSDAAPAIRLACPEDADALARLYAQLGYPTPAEAIRHALAQPIPPGQTFVAEWKGQVAGALELHILTTTFRDNDPTAQVQTIVVDESCRSQGIGEALMDHAYAVALQAGCGRIELISNHKREAAHRFYERHGFASPARYFRKGVLKP